MASSGCQRCNQSHSIPEAFLLTCRGCSKSWHHRCLMPPMEDLELVQLIRATNAGDSANNLGSWMCRRCKKRASATPSAMSSREPTASVEGSTTSRDTDASGVADVRVKQESNTMVDARLVNERNKKSDGQLAEVKPTLVAQRAKPPAVNQHHAQPQPGPTQPRDANVRIAGVTPQERKRSPKRPSPPTHSHPFRAARKLIGITATTSSEDDVAMQVDSPPHSGATSRATSQASHAPSSVTTESAAEIPPPVRAVSITNQRGPEVGPAVEAAIQAQVNPAAADEVDDDPEDLYGPPVERRIIRILPSLAEELREQQRRVAAEKARRRAPLAPDWILARHVDDPLWKEIPTQGRKRRKPVARKLGENGLNVDELMGCFTAQAQDKERI